MVTDEVRKAIDANNRRFSEGFLKGDASITASVFARDAVVFPPDAPMIQGRESIEEFWRTVMAAGVKEVELTTIELSGSGDYLHERGTGILRVRPRVERPQGRGLSSLSCGSARRTAGRVCGISGMPLPDTRDI